MSSSTSALGSSSAAYFTGMSDFSQDLNNAIQRAVQISGLPIQLLQNDANGLTNQFNELQTLSGDVAAVQSAVSSLASAARSMLQGSVSDPSIATVTVGSGATAGSYSLEVTKLGSHSNALSNDGLAKVTNPAAQDLSASSSYTLTVNGKTMSIARAEGSLNALAQAITAAGAGVQATVVNVGSNSAPDYRLSLQSNELGPMAMQLNDGQHDLLTASVTPGTLAQYRVNGKEVQSSSDLVTLAPGVTLQLTGSDAGATSTVTVASDPSGIGAGLQTFVSNYNSAIAELNHNRGQTDTALAGQSIVYTLTRALQNLAGYATGTGNISSLAALGVKFSDTTGQLSFDQGTFDAAASGQAAALTQFLGSATDGGFLKAATDAMAGLLDPARGVLPQDISIIQSNINSTNSQIADKQAALTLLQSNLTQQMAAADTLIYALQQQSSQMQDMFTAMYYRSTS